MIAKYAGYKNERGEHERNYGVSLAIRAL